MIKEFKTILQLLKYGNGIKVLGVLSILCSLFGIVLVFISSDMARFLGGFYFVLGVLFLFQIILSLNSSKLIQSSGYKKKIETFYVFLLSVPLILINYTIMVFIYCKMADDESKNYIFLLALMVFFVLIYFGICFKYYIIPTFVFMIISIPTMVAIMDSESIYEKFFFYNDLKLTIVVSYAVILIGIAISMLLIKALYKKDFSKYAFGRFNSKNTK